MTVGSLCSGFGGLEIAALELWPDASVAWHAEIDPHASHVLAAHWPDVPNLGDLSAADWADVEPVDVLTAGYPCQPFSTAGRRKGEDDARHLWPGVLRAVRHLRPRLVLLENVAGHLSLGFGRVLGDLAEVGYVGSWTCLRASDVGAPHRRDRVFIAAHPHGEARRQMGDAEPGDGVAAHVGRGPTEPGRRRGIAADADTSGPEVGRGLAPGSRPRCRPAQCPAAFGAYQPAIDRWAAVLGRPAPPALDDRRLNARFVEWMIGLPDGWVTDLVPRRHALRILGNGVVPAQAAAAYRNLLAVAAASAVFPLP